MQAQRVNRAQDFELPAERGVGELKLIGAARSFARDQEIFGEGEPADCFYKVVSGVTRSFRVLADGRRQIGQFHLPGDVFGVEADNRRRVSCEAVNEATLIVARRANLMTGDKGEAAQLWRLAMSELERAQDHILTLGRRNACERLATFLMDFADRRGVGDSVELPMSRQDIADHLGLTIETVSRTFSQFQADGLIEIHGCRQVWFADPEGLDHLRQ